MHTDIVSHLPPAGGYRNIITARDVFSIYLFANPKINQNAETVARVMFNIFTEHAYLSATIISDDRSAFVSREIKEVADVLGFTLGHATIKHALAIGMSERTHTALEKEINVETGGRRSIKYVPRTCLLQCA